MSLPSLNEALSLMNQGAFTAARAICQQHLAYHADDFNARHLLGLVQFKAGNLLAATKELTKATRLKSPPRFKAQALNNLALVLQARGKHEPAIAHCRQALELAPAEIAFHLNLLGLLEQRSQWSQMIDHLGSHPALADDADARLFHAVAARHLQQHDIALQLLGTPGSSVEAESERALNLCLTGGTQAVIADWQHSGQPVDCLIQLADYVAEEGFAEVATPLYQAAADADPGNLSVRHMLNAALGDCTAAAPSEYVRTLYDTHADQFEQRLQGRLGYDAPARLCLRLGESIDPQLPLHAADLGCGTGLCGVELRRRLNIKHLEGCDLSAAMLQQAASKNCYDSLKRTSLLDYLMQLAPVELITATDVLIYTGDLQPIFAILPKALKQNGLFAFTVELNRNGEEVSLHTSGRYRHSREHIQRLADEYGLSVRLLETFPLRNENEVSLAGLMVILQRV